MCFRQIVWHFPANLKSLLSVMVPYSSAVTIWVFFLSLCPVLLNTSCHSGYPRNNWLYLLLSFSPLWSVCVFLLIYHFCENVMDHLWTVFEWGSFCHVNIKLSLLPPDKYFSSCGCSNSEKEMTLNKWCEPDFKICWFLKKKATIKSKHSKCIW